MTNRQRRRVSRHERPLAPRGQPVNPARDELLARPARPEDQGMCAGPRVEGHLVPQPPHRRALPEEAHLARLAERPEQRCRVVLEEGSLRRPQDTQEKELAFQKERVPGSHDTLVHLRPPEHDRALAEPLHRELPALPGDAELLPRDPGALRFPRDAALPRPPPAERHTPRAGVRVASPEDPRRALHLEEGSLADATGLLRGPGDHERRHVHIGVGAPLVNGGRGLQSGWVLRHGRGLSTGSAGEARKTCARTPAHVPLRIRNGRKQPFPAVVAASPHWHGT